MTRIVFRNNQGVTMLDDLSRHYVVARHGMT